MRDPDTMRERTALDPRGNGGRPKDDPVTPLSDDQPTRVQVEPTPADTATDGLQFPALPGYEMLTLLGRGGMGIVYKARQLGLNRLVAVKVLPPHGRLTGEEWTRFVTEAELLARCAHPNIVQVHNFGTHDGLPYLTLEYIEGGSLATRLKNTPQSPVEAATLIETLAQAVHHAHQQGIIHRDLKPANILMALVDRGAWGAARDQPESQITERITPAAPALCPKMLIPKVTDFGLARAVESESALTRTGAVMGTPSYMAPEQALGLGDKIGVPVDVHALGAILYEMLTGRPPYKGTTPAQTLEQVRTQDPVAPRLIVATIPRDLETICLKCLEKEPERRYASAADLAEDLRRFRLGEPIVARPVSQIEHVTRWCRRRPSVAALYGVSVAAVALLATLGIVFILYSLHADHELELAHAEAEQQERAAREKDRLAEEAELRAATHAYYRGMNTVRERQEQSPLNWREQNLREILALARGMPPDVSVSGLRSEAVATLSAMDVGFPRETATSFTASAVTFSPDGKLLALAMSKAQLGARATVLLLDPETGKCVQKLTYWADQRWQKEHGVQDGSRSIVFANDGSWVAVGTRSGTIHRWDLREKNPQRATWQAHRAEVNRLAVGGECLYSCSSDHTVKCWNGANGWKLAATFTGAHAAGFTDLVASPTGWVAVVGDGYLTLLDAKTLAARKDKLPVKSERLCLGADKRTLYLTRNAAPLVVDTETMLVLRQADHSDEREGPGDRVSDIQRSPDGTLLAIATDERNYVDLWDVAANRRIKRLNHGDGWIRVAFAPNGSKLVVLVDTKSLVYPIKGGDVQSTAGLHARRVYDVGWGSGGLFAYAARAEGGSEVTYWPQSDRRLSLNPAERWPLYPFGENNAPLAVDPHANSAAVRVDHQRVAYCKPGSAEVLEMPWKKTHALQFSTDGRLWAARDCEVEIHTLTPDRLVAAWSNAVQGQVLGLGQTYALASGRRFTLAGGRDGLLRRLDGNAGLMQTWPLTRDALTSVALNGDQTLAAVGTTCGELFVVRTGDGGVLTHRKVHRDEIASLVWLGQDRLATSSRDGMIIFWRLERCSTGPKVAELFTIKCGAPVRRLALSPDGKTLAVCVHGERAARLWHLEQLEQRLTRLGLDPGALTPQR